MTKYIYHDKIYLDHDLFSSYRRKKKCIRIVFRKDLYGDVRFTVVFRKLTKNNEKLKKNNVFFSRKKNCFRQKIKWRECSETRFAEVWALYELVFGGKRPFKVLDHGPKACLNAKQMFLLLLKLILFCCNVDADVNGDADADADANCFCLSIVLGR